DEEGRLGGEGGGFPGGALRLKNIMTVILLAGLRRVSGSLRADGAGIGGSALCPGGSAGWPGRGGRQGRLTVRLFFQAEDGIRDHCVTGVQTCALPISVVARLGRCVAALTIMAATLVSPAF